MNERRTWLTAKPREDQCPISKAVFTPSVSAVAWEELHYSQQMSVSVAMTACKFQIRTGSFQKRQTNAWNELSFNTTDL